MAVLKKWSAFFNRTDLTTNDNFQVVGIDLSNATPANRNQRTPITQLLRAGKDLADLSNVSNAVTNLGATSASTANALARRNASGIANFAGVNLDGASQPTLNIGATSTFNIGNVTGGGQFFTGTVSGDTCIRATNTGRQLLLGVGTGAAQFAILNTVIQSNLTHKFGYAGTNRMPYLDASSNLTGSSNYTVNGTGGLTITQNFTASGVILATSGATAGTLNYYEENVSFSLTMNTPDGTTHPLPLTVTRIGKIVVVEWDSLTVTANTATTFNSSITLPTKWRPVVAAGIMRFTPVTDNTVAAQGRMSISSTGVVTFGVGVSGGNFTNSGQAIIQPGSVSYLTS